MYAEQSMVKKKYFSDTSHMAKIPYHCSDQEKSGFPDAWQREGF